MIKKTIELKHDFSESEINEIAHTLTDCIIQKSSIMEDKASAMKGFNGQVKFWDKKIDHHSNLINDGFEYRDVACEVTYNDPVNGQKTIMRLDTFDKWQEPMTIEEYNLFDANNVPTDTVANKLDKIFGNDGNEEE